MCYGILFVLDLLGGIMVISSTLCGGWCLRHSSMSCKKCDTIYDTTEARIREKVRVLHKYSPSQEEMMKELEELRLEAKDAREREDKRLNEIKTSLMMLPACYNCLCCMKRNVRRATPWSGQWRSYKKWKYALCVIFWIRSLVVYCDVTGTCLGSRANQSSCTNNYDLSDSVFNINGGFHGTERFQSNGTYTFCTMYSTWAKPTPSNYVRQFERTNRNTAISSQLLNCNVEVPQGDPVPGTIITNVGQCPGKPGTYGYPSPAFGIRTGVGSIPAILPGQTSNSSAANCPGNSGQPQCFLPNSDTPVSCSDDRCPEGSCPFVSAAPFCICSLCLNYWRTSFEMGNSDPSCYEHCEIGQPGPPLNYFCAVCPGLGQGVLADEIIEPGEVITTFWLSTTYAIFDPFVEILLLTYLLSTENKERRTANFR